jgi:opacity protein-like surface antigen
MASSTFAQDSKVEDVFKKYRFGLYVGPTFNSLKNTVDKAEDSKGNYDLTKGSGRTSFSVGLNAELGLNEKYSLYSGIGLDWNGGGINASHDTSSVLDPEYASSADINYKTQFLSIPLGLKMYAAELGDVKIFAQTGIDVSLLLSQKGDYTLKGAAVTDSTGANQKINDVARVVPINVGWHIGAGAEYQLSSGSAVYGAILYRNGFTDFTTPSLNEKGNRFSDGNIRSNTIAIRIGYFF